MNIPIAIPIKWPVVICFSVLIQKMFSGLVRLELLVGAMIHHSQRAGETRVFLRVGLDPVVSLISCDLCPILTRRRMHRASRDHVATFRKAALIRNLQKYAQERR